VRQSQASAAASGSMLVNFVVAAVLISAAVPLKAALGAGGLFALFAALHVLIASAALRLAWRKAAEARAAAAGSGVTGGVSLNPAAALALALAEDVELASKAAGAAGGDEQQQ